MSYTALTVIAIVSALAMDHWGLRTRLTSSRTWWSAYAIIVFFQLLTNGWLTGRRIVSYAPDTIVGNDRVVLVGEGRLLYAPVEDIGFGFALVLWSCAVWVWLERRRGDAATSPSGPATR